MINQLKKQYVWKGTITAGTTGQYIWLDGDNTKELDFVENVVYQCKLTSLCKFTDNSNFLFQKALLNNGNIFKSSINGYSNPSYENNIIGNFTYGVDSPYSTQDPDDLSTNGLGFDSLITSNKLRLECTYNVLTKDAEIKFIITVEDIYNPFAL